MGLSQAQIDWLNSAVPFANQQAARTGLSSEYILAQAALESRYGQSGLATNYNNYFGIKGTGAYLPTTECNASGYCYKTNAGFASYGSMGESFDAYGNYILKHGTNGYATDPNYSSKISKTIDTIKSAIGTAAKLLTGSNPITAPVAAAGGLAKGVTDAVGLTGKSWVQQIREWLDKSHFWQRVTVVLLALVLIWAAFYLFGSKK